jgi:hypothetical protein
MQVFCQNTNSNEGQGQGKTVQCGNHNVRVVRASSLTFGTHTVRFYPLSPDYYKGADYPYIVQSFHWINNQPIICRRTSYDYTTVPDVEEKHIISNECPICYEKFELYKRAKSLGYVKDLGYQGSPPASVALHKEAKALNERPFLISLVSFVENQQLTFPVVLTYGKELFDKIQFSAGRIFDSSGINICDPQKGYLFDIIVGQKPNSRQRDYKQSMPSLNTTTLDITKNPWDWQEVCHAVKSEIVAIPTEEEVIAFYESNQKRNNQKRSFIHPALAPQAQPVNYNQPVNPVNYAQPVNPVQQTQPVNSVQQTQPVNSVQQTQPVNPVQQTQPVQTQPVNPVNYAQPVNPVQVPEFTPRPTDNDFFPCHGSAINSTGYVADDAACKGCAQVQSCITATNARQGATNPVTQTTPIANTNNVIDDVQDKLNALQRELNP